MFCSLIHLQNTLHMNSIFTAICCIQPIVFFLFKLNIKKNTGFELGFDHWGTFSFLGGQKFVHPSADAKGFVFLAGLLIGLGRKSQISRDF